MMSELAGFGGDNCLGDPLEVRNTKYIENIIDSRDRVSAMEHKITACHDSTIVDKLKSLLT